MGLIKQNTDTSDIYVARRYFISYHNINKNIN